MKKNGPILHTLDLLFATRPMLLIPVWGFIVFGFWNAHHQKHGALLAFRHFYTPSMVFWSFVFSLSVSAVYLLNQIADSETDAHNPGLPLIASGIVGKSSAWIMAAILGTISIVVPLVQNRATLSLLSTLALTTGVLYSFKPTFFSGRPILDFVANAIGYGVIAFGAGWYLGSGRMWSGAMCSAALPYFLLMCAGSLSSTVPDIDGDKRTGKITSAVRFGEFNAQILAAGFLCAASIVSWFAKDRVALTCAISSIPIYAAYFIFRRRAMMEATYKIGGLACMIVSMALSPVLFAGAFLTFCATWLYFRIRHGVLYPTLVPRSNEK